MAGNKQNKGAKRKQESSAEYDVNKQIKLEPQNNNNNNNQSTLMLEQTVKSEIKPLSEVETVIFNEGISSVTKAEIASHLPLKSVLALSQTSKYWLNLLSTHTPEGYAVKLEAKKSNNSVLHRARVLNRITDKIAKLGLDTDALSMWIRGFDNTTDDLLVFETLVDGAIIADNNFNIEKGKVTGTKRDKYTQERKKIINKIAEYLIIDLKGLDLTGINITSEPPGNVEKFALENVEYVKTKLENETNLLPYVDTLLQKADNFPYSELKYHINEIKLLLLEKLSAKRLDLNFKKIFANTNPFVLFVLTLLRSDELAGRLGNSQIPWYIGLIVTTQGVSYSVIKFLFAKTSRLSDDYKDELEKMLNNWIGRHIKDENKLTQIDVIKEILKSSTVGSGAKILEYIANTEDLKKLNTVIKGLQTKAWARTLFAEKSVDYLMLVSFLDIPIPSNNKNSEPINFFTVLKKSTDHAKIMFKCAEERGLSLFDFATTHAVAIGALYVKALDELQRMSKEEMDSLFIDQDKNRVKKVATKNQQDKVFSKLANHYIPIGKTKKRLRENIKLLDLMRELSNKYPKTFDAIQQAQENCGAYVVFFMKDLSVLKIDVEQFKDLIEKSAIPKIQNIGPFNFTIPNRKSLEDCVRTLEQIKDKQGEGVSLYDLFYNLKHTKQFDDKTIKLYIKLFCTLAKRLLDILNRDPKFIDDYIDYLQDFNIVKLMRREPSPDLTLTMIEEQVIARIFGYKKTSEMEVQSSVFKSPEQESAAQEKDVKPPTVSATSTYGAVLGIMPPSEESVPVLNNAYGFTPVFSPAKSDEESENYNLNNDNTPMSVDETFTNQILNFEEYDSPSNQN